MHLRQLLHAVAAALVVLIPALACAEEATLEEVIVTARKRQESILNVPVIETAIGQQQLEQFQTADFKDIASRVPGLALGDAVLTIGTQVSLRGVGTTTLDAGVDQSVSLNLDGLQLTQGLAYSSAVFDVGQVEILKGPQALFYGKNSPGGVIAVRTADPTDQFELSATYGRELVARENRPELIVSGPVSDSLKLRLAAFWDDSDGYFRNTGVAEPGLGGLTPPHHTLPLDQNYLIRGTALWTPIDELTARLKLNFSHDLQREAGKEQLTSCPQGTGAVPGIGIDFIGHDDCTMNRYLSTLDLDPKAFPGVREGGVPFLDSTQRFGTLELNYRLAPDITLTSTTGYYRVIADGLINGSMSTFAGPTIGADNNFHRRDVTEELRATSDFSTPVNFTVGGYAQDAQMDNIITLLGNTSYLLPALLTRGSHDVRIRSYSGFGQLRWAILPPLELAAGGRFTHEKRSDRPYDLTSGTPVPTAIPVPGLESNSVSPELTLTYKPADNITAFGSLKKAFKSGSYSITVPATPGEDNSFGDEKAEGGEVGLKTRWLEHRLAVNLAFYDYRYLGLQVGASETNKGLPITRTVNAGSARVYGLDMDVAYRPELVAGLELHGSANRNQARFQTLNNVPCWAGQTVSEGCDVQFNPVTGAYQAQNLAGYPLVRAPDWQASFGFSYETPINNAMSLSFSSESQYSSRYLTNLGANRADFFQSSFLKTDATVALKESNDRWQVALIGKNLGDKLTSAHCDAANFQNGVLFGGENTGLPAHGPAGQGEVACFVDRGREVWLRIRVKPRG